MIMKKIATLVITALVVSSISGCANRNTDYGNQNNMNRGTNQGTAQGTRTGYGTNNVGTTQGAYKDGIYTGEGERGANGNQTATVVISGGRITDITLRTVDAQGRDAAGTGTVGRATGMAREVGDTAGTPGSRYFNTPGITAGGVGADTAEAPRGNTGYVTGDYSFQNIGGDAGGMIGGTVDGASGTGNTGWATGGTGNGSFERERTQLARRIIDQQTADIALNENDTSEARNWKLAVRRALDKARTSGTAGGAATGGTGAGTGTMGGTTGGTTGAGTIGGATGGTTGTGIGAGTAR
jgi:uncharacterized protein with FMN-binding domain